MRLLERKHLAAVAAVTLLAVACGGDDVGGGDGGDGGGDGPTAAAADLALVTEGTLTVCTDSPYPPMEFEQDGEYTGFDIELMRAIADQIGLGTEVVNTGFDPIVSGTALAAGECDIAAASITITEERDQNVDFTEPYFEADQSLLVKKDSGISTLEDLAGQTIGVQDGTTGEMYAQENAPDDTEIVAFDAADAMFVALEAGEVQALLQDLVVNQGRALDDDTVAVVDTFPTDEQYGFAVAEEGSDALLEAVNEALATVRENGTYEEIYNQFFTTPDAGAE